MLGVGYALSAFYGAFCGPSLLLETEGLEISGMDDMAMQCCVYISSTYIVHEMFSVSAFLFGRRARYYISRVIISPKALI
jgi:hypothetical protein